MSGDVGISERKINVGLKKMKVVILAGGLGTRLMEETAVRPKPMVEIGGRPILWHIMKMYETYGFTDFIICFIYVGFFELEWRNFSIRKGF